jgi:hypothetical protein
LLDVLGVDLFEGVDVPGEGHTFRAVVVDLVLAIGGLGDEALAVLHQQDPELLGDAAALAAQPEADPRPGDVAIGVDLGQLGRVGPQLVHRRRRGRDAGLGEHVLVVVKGGRAIEQRHAADLTAVGRVRDRRRDEGPTLT